MGSDDANSHYLDKGVVIEFLEEHVIKLIHSRRQVHKHLFLTSLVLEVLTYVENRCKEFQL